MRYSLTLILGLVIYLALPHGALALININTGTLDELKTLHGIGDVIGQRIINARPFSSVEDIKRVNGIGDVTYEGMKNNITVESTSVVTTNIESKTSSGGGVMTEATKPAILGPITGLTITVPELAYVGQLLTFDVNPSDGTSRTARYRWNFGDGTTDDYKKPSHRYARPGTYVVMVESYYQKETKLARKEIEILPLALKLEILSSEEVRVVNNGSHEIDLGRMSLFANSTFTFPKYTILLSGQSLVAKVNNSGSVSLKDGEGVVLGVGAVEAKLPPRPVAVAIAPRSVAKVTTPIKVTSTEEVSAETSSSRAGEARVPTSTQAASLPSADIPTAAWPYLALFGVIGLGIFAMYSTRS